MTNTEVHILIPLEKKFYPKVNIFHQFLHTVDEILFANVDISSAVLNTILTQLAESMEFQSALRAEYQEQKTQESFDLVKYISKQDSLLNFLIMESMRLTPAFCKFLSVMHQEHLLIEYVEGSLYLNVFPQTRILVVTTFLQIRL
jgi:Cytochrome P450